MNGWGSGGTWGWDGWAAMGVMMLVLTAAVVVASVALVVWATRSSTSHRTYETPRSVLDRRLAAGEINDEEYAAARRLIEDRPITSAG